MSVSISTLRWQVKNRRPELRDRVGPLVFVGPIETGIEFYASDIPDGLLNGQFCTDLALDIYDEVIDQIQAALDAHIAQWARHVPVLEALANLRGTQP